MLAGLSVGELGPGGVPGGTIVKSAFTEPPLYAAVTVTGTMNRIGAVLTENIDEVAPSGTKALDGTPAIKKLEPLDSTMPAPPTGAGAVSVMVPTVVSPLSIVGGLKLSAERNGRS